MKLKDIIEQLDKFSYFKLYHCDDSDYDEPTWSGYMLDMPWCYLDCELDTTRDYEAISCTHFTNECGVDVNVFIINLKG